LRIDSGSWRRARLESGRDDVVAQDMNPAVIVGLCMLGRVGDQRYWVGQVVIGIHRPAGRAELNVSRVSLVLAANGGSVGNKRPNRPAHRNGSRESVPRSA
jgi:hypothetical protein